MRYLLVALSLLASISGAFAQEFEVPKLRGSYILDAEVPHYRPHWSEFYTQLAGREGDGGDAVAKLGAYSNARKRAASLPVDRARQHE